MDFLSRITLTCFAASYLVAFIFELTRFLFRIRVRAVLTIGMMTAGLFAHTVYLFAQSRVDLANGVPLSSWDSWCLVGAWLLAGAYLHNVIRSPKTPTGLLLLPLAMALIIAAFFLEDVGTFSKTEAKNLWRIVHGLSLLAGTVTVSFGFVSGILYLIESARLKRKKIMTRRFAFPSLERLQIAGERSLMVSAFLLGLGVLSGVVINLSDQDSPSAAIQWTDPVIWTSVLLFAWLLAAVIFSLVYKPARQGRKVAYLVVASFLFLIMALSVALTAQHGGQTETRSMRNEVETAQHSSCLPRSFAFLSEEDEA